MVTCVAAGHVAILALGDDELALFVTLYGNSDSILCAQMLTCTHTQSEQWVKG